jgi:hypothetical protein
MPLALEKKVAETDRKRSASAFGAQKKSRQEENLKKIKKLKEFFLIRKNLNENLNNNE